MKKLITVLLLVIITIACFNEKFNYSSNKFINNEEDEYNFVKASFNVNNDLAEGSFMLFKGRDTLYKIKLREEKEALFEYNINIEEGKFKLVLVSGKDVKIIEEGNGNGKRKVNLPKGETRIKIIGYNAKGNIQLKVKNVEVEVNKS